jgi:hypothetical protein
MKVTNIGCSANNETKAATTTVTAFVTAEGLAATAPLYFVEGQDGVPSECTIVKAIG